MEFHVSTSSRQPIYQQLARQVREGVARGRLQPGDRLPSVRELSRKLVVNPNTIARAYTELERDGVLHSRQGQGVFIAEFKTDLTKPARKKQIAESIDQLLTEAIYLGFTQNELQREVEIRADKFQWGSDS